MTKITKFDNHDDATALHFLAKYDHVARCPVYPAFAWRILSSRFRRLAAARADGDVFAVIALDCWQRAELAEFRDARRRRWTWGFAPVAVTAVVVAVPQPTALATSDHTPFN